MRLTTLIKFWGRGAEPRSVQRKKYLSRFFWCEAHKPEGCFLTRSGKSSRVLIEDKYEGSYSYLSLTLKYPDVTLLISEVNDMAISMGSPVLKLDRQNHFGKSDKHSGNAQAVLEEMFPDEEGQRHTSDRDYNPELTKDNLFYEWDYESNSFKSRKTISSKEVVDKYYSEAEAYKRVDKNGKERSLRDDAVICVAGILKPSIDSEEWQEYDEQEKIKYLKTAVSVQSGLLKKRGIQIEFFTVHMDEGNPHIHWVGKDKSYQMGKKVGLPLFNDFNEKLPKILTSKGYETRVLKSFDTEGYGKLSDEQKEEYVKQKKAKKKENGQKSEDYKKQKEIERAKAEELKELRVKAAEYDKLIEQATISKQYHDELADNISDYQVKLELVLAKAEKQLNSNELELSRKKELQNIVEEITKLEAPELVKEDEIKEIVEARAEHYKQVDKEDTNRYAEKKKPIKKKSIPVREVPQSLEKARRDDISFNK